MNENGNQDKKGQPNLSQFTVSEAQWRENIMIGTLLDVLKTDENF